MGGDMVVALGRATVDGNALFGHNSSSPALDGPALVRLAGRSYALGEKVLTQYLELPQARQTYTVLGTKTRGVWGCQQGLNEHGVAIGCTAVQTRLRCNRPGLLGSDLVRLTLERSRCARQAVDVLTDLITRHGQGPFPGCPPQAEQDNAFLIADGREAFAVEAGGPHWVYQEIGEVRAMSEACTVRQDWNWISHGLAAHAIAQGWWPGDGTKLDFAGALCPKLGGRDWALRRWGRATLLLEQQNGHIDAAFLRRLLSDHYEGCREEVDPLKRAKGPVPLCRHPRGPRSSSTAVSLVASLATGPEWLPMAWWCLGPPCLGVYFPVFIDGELPEAFGRGTGPKKGSDPLTAEKSPGANAVETSRKLLQHVGRDRKRWHSVRESLARLQARLDQEVDEFRADAVAMRGHGSGAELQRAASLFMRHALEQFEETVNGLLGTRRGSAAFSR